MAALKRLSAAAAAVALLLLAAATPTLAAPASTAVNPDAVISATCVDPSANIVFHDQNVALLAICGGIAGAITKCGGNPATTVGQSGTAKFTLSAIDKGATINISKGRWEQCINAARAICPTGSIRAECPLGATTGNTQFVLDNP